MPSHLNVKSSGEAKHRSRYREPSTDKECVLYRNRPAGNESTDKKIPAFSSGSAFHY
ncbi:MAG: hypothetical protein V2I54_12840 [Bacteroidales bacterium]|jgi:hypothetical protein|nr:hypothetical protein [Bacteroidales bacterium]